MAEDQAPDRLAVVRWNIARRRNLAGVSQAELAERMTERGVKLFPQTIQKIENGSRTLRFDEAVVLCEALGIEMWELLQKPAEEYLDDEVLRFHRAQRDLRSAVVDTLDAQERAAIIVDQAGDMGNDSVPEVLEAHPLAAAHEALRGSVRSRREGNRLALLSPDGPPLGTDRAMLMTDREHLNYEASPEGTTPRADELLERRRAWFGKMGEEASSGVDQQTF